MSRDYGLLLNGSKAALSERVMNTKQEVQWFTLGDPMVQYYPFSGKQVLICGYCEDGQPWVAEAFFDTREGGRWIMGLEGIDGVSSIPYQDDLVSYWMPLPEAPKRAITAA